MRRCGRWARSAALCILVLAGCAGPDDSLERDAAAVRRGPPVPYGVAFTGPIEPDLEARLRSVSEAEAGRASPPTSALALRSRARTDAERLTAALASEGYYEGRVDPAVVPATEERDAEIRFDVEPGPRYELAAVRIDLIEDAQVASFVPPSAADLGLEPGMPARADAVLAAEQRLLEAAREAGRARASLGDRDAIIDRSTKTMDVVLRLDPGPIVTLAEPEFQGTDGIDDDFLRAYVAWAPGERFRPELVRDTRRDLVGTGLFRTVDVALAENVLPDGTTPVTITVEQRLHRTISAGARYDTDGGPGVSFAWEHRNFFGRGDRFRVDVDADLLEQSVLTRYRQPDTFGRDSALLAEADLIREDTDAFDSLEAAAGLGVEYRFSERLDGTVALRVSASEVTDANGTERFALVSLPAALRYDDTDDLLDPTRGVRLRGEVTPFQGISDTDLQFNRVRLDGSTYYRVSQAPRVVLAARGAVGSIFGADVEDIPANQRFYAGGGGSIRGIPFQAASPRDANGDPSGGRSLVEVVGEIRYGITETIGAVAFVDAGRAFESTAPDFAEPLDVGAGLGVRYLTPIGPLRLDVAVPVVAEDVDESFQVYVSVGQAF